MSDLVTPEPQRPLFQEKERQSPEMITIAETVAVLAERGARSVEIITAQEKKIEAIQALSYLGLAVIVLMTAFALLDTYKAKIESVNNLSSQINQQSLLLQKMELEMKFSKEKIDDTHMGLRLRGIIPK